MEFNDKRVNDELASQFEIVLQDDQEHAAVVTAMRKLAISAMTGECATVTPKTADELLRYLSLDFASQCHQTTTFAQALSFARLVQHGAVGLPSDERALALSIANAIELEVLVRNMLDQSGDIQPDDFK
ncbi:MAG: hypothetical protein JWM07_158 [Candidatus Saccharibacteria bacterium]|jgi:hypothetical protein|nr:hypothetical protein [Candidatus Saccharibacteria bacterium]